MNHAMTPPVPEDGTCTRWVERDTFDLPPGQKGCHGLIAPVEHTWSPETGLYEWTRTGSLTGVEGRSTGHPRRPHSRHTCAGVCLEITSGRGTLPYNSLPRKRERGFVYQGIGTPYLSVGSDATCYEKRHHQADGPMRKPCG